MSRAWGSMAEGHAALAEAAEHLEVRVRSSGRIKGRRGKARFVVSYRYALDEFRTAPVDRQRFWIHVKRRWTDARVSVRRRNELSSKQLARLPTRLGNLSDRQQRLVLEALTDFTGPFLLTRRGLQMSAPVAGTSGAALAHRVDVAADYLERLALG